jgi:hypothetical protein
MKVIIEENLGITIEYFLRYLPFISKIAKLQDSSQINKALNDFEPDLLILNTTTINSVIKAYADKHKCKIISYGQNDIANLCIVQDTTIANDNIFYDKKRPTLETISFKENVNKTDISIFLNDPHELSLAEFLCLNYNVKVYGNVPMRNPRYLGMVSLMDKYEIINKSKIIVDLGTYDFYNAILLDTYPIIYTNEQNDNMYTSFNNLTSLMSSLDYVLDEVNQSTIQDKLIGLKKQCYVNNDLVFVIDCLKKLKYNNEVEKLNKILEDITC